MVSTIIDYVINDSIYNQWYIVQNNIPKDKNHNTVASALGNYIGINVLKLPIYNSFIV